MSKIIVEAHSSDIAENSVIALLKGGFQVRKARISYNLQKGLPLVEETDKYPLILEGKFGSWSSVSVYVYSVTAGYSGSGPHAMLSILKAAGFELQKDDILTDKHADAHKQIQLTFTR